MRKIVITGSKGLVGKRLTSFFKKTDSVYELDILFNHNLTDEKFVKQWFKKNKADYLINCFALNDHGKSKTTLFDFPLSSFSKYLEVNLTALFSVCREFARNNKKGGIVNFSSTYGIVSPRPDLYEGFHKEIAYGITKAGVINMTKYLAVHLAPHIQVNCIVPGGIGDDQSQQMRKSYSKFTPMNRMMKSSELNGVVDFLCNPKSSYITGSSIVADGGFTIW